MTELLSLALTYLREKDLVKRSAFNSAFESWSPEIQLKAIELAEKLLAIEALEMKKQECTTLIEKEEKNAIGWRAHTFGVNLALKKKAEKELMEVVKTLETLYKTVKALKRQYKLIDQEEADRKEISAWIQSGFQGAPPSYSAREHYEWLNTATTVSIAKRGSFFISY